MHQNPASKLLLAVKHYFQTYQRGQALAKNTATKLLEITSLTKLVVITQGHHTYSKHCNTTQPPQR